MEKQCTFNSGFFSLRRSGFSLGRQEIREVATRRSKEIVQFLHSLFSCAEEVAHSDLVYTFFHPLLRDQEEANVHIRKLRGERGTLQGWAKVRFPGSVNMW